MSMALREAKCSRRRAKLGGTGGVIAARDSFFGVAGERTFARGAFVGEGIFYGVVGSLVAIYPYDFGDHVAAFFDEHGVADANTLAADFVRVVEAGSGDGRASQRHGF